MSWSLLLLALLLSPAARAQSQGCVEVPRGIPLDLAARVPLPGARAELALPGVPSRGHDCVPIQPPAPDVLRGPPAPGGLLRGEAPPRTRVTVTPR